MNSLIPRAGALVGDSKLTTLLQGVLFAGSAYNQGRSYYERWREGQTYTIRISSSDDIYPEIHSWLLGQMPDREQRSLSANSSWRDDRDRKTYDEDSYNGGPIASSSGSVRMIVKYQYDGRRVVRIKVQGYPVTVMIDRDIHEEAGKFSQREDEIVFVMPSLAARQCVMTTIESIAATQSTGDAPKTMIATSYGWSRTQSIPPRDPATVILATGKMERLNADLDLFMKSEALYARIGMPWHRGYLFHGPPGGGKSSAARALAFAHKMDVYYLPLSDVKSDTNLAQSIAQIRGRSILLIEDIDITHATTSREDTDKLSLQGLLNALDGALTPHGLITIMTTNQLDSLDPALIRKGRCDIIEEIGYLTDEQLVRLVEVMTGISGPLPALGKRQLVAAEITEIVKEHIEDMDQARAAIVEFLKIPKEKVA